MNDQMITHGGELISAHVGPIHVERTERGVDITLVGAVNPTASLTVEQARRISTVLAAAR